jgi:hypothetical protein
MRDFKSTILSIISVMMIGPTGAHANSIETKLAELITDGRSSCDGSFTLLDGAVERIDLNLDDEIDLAVLDAGGFSCDESTSMYCGSAGCVVHFITSADYFYGYTRGWQIIRAKSDQPIILLELHGVSCGEVGATPCYSAVSIFAGRFIAVKR